MTKIKETLIVNDTCLSDLFADYYVKNKRGKWEKKAFIMKKRRRVCFENFSLSGCGNNRKSCMCPEMTCNECKFSDDD